MYIMVLPATSVVTGNAQGIRKSITLIILFEEAIVIFHVAEV